MIEQEYEGVMQTSETVAELGTCGLCVDSGFPHSTVRVFSVDIEANIAKVSRCPARGGRDG